MPCRAAVGEQAACGTYADRKLCFVLRAGRAGLEYEHRDAPIRAVDQAIDGSAEDARIEKRKRNIEKRLARCEQHGDPIPQCLDPIFNLQSSIFNAMSFFLHGPLRLQAFELDL